ncbi:PAS domain-containing protein [Bacillus andreraoultii]|uniref:PAS domain-containing protein n=1 Tax=Bacillus andreraoultii TaxID=1499685 RepID=UPI00067F1E26|nr:PAS domain-containing sensor histidine kinase [Bacillus andreraoultii]
MEANQSNLNFEEIIGQITDAFFVLDSNWIFKYINTKGAEMIGRKDSSELIGKCLWDEFPAAIHNNFYKNYRKVMDKKIPIEFDEFYPEPLNRWFHARAYPLTEGISVFFHDVTEIKIKQKQNDAHYEQLFAQNHDGILLVDVEGNITSANRGMERITGYHIGYFLDKKFFEGVLVDEIDPLYLKSVFNKVISGETQTMSLDLKHRNGAIIHCDITCFPVVVLDEIVGVFVIIRDVTKIKELEWNLRRSEQKYRSLKYHNPEGICSFDLNGKLIGVNPALEAMSGYSRDEFLLLHMEQLFHPDDIPILTDCIQNILDGEGTVDSFNIKMLNKDGQLLHTVLTVVPIYIEEVLEGFYLIIKDVTEAKKTEELLIQSEKLSAVGQLAASIVHEIRNPLTSLMGFLQLIEHSYGVKDDYIKIMSDELMRINSITNELLVLAKPQAKKTQEEDIVHLVTDVIKLMNTQALLAGIEITLIKEEHVPKLMCDGQQLKQVFINLIKNGIEAMTGKTGTIFVNIKRTGNHIEVSIRDEGMGMTEEQIKHIGEPFFTTKRKGTGLGMLMTSSIIENYNGQLKITSEVGKGTTMSVYLPLES